MLLLLLRLRDFLYLSMRELQIAATLMTLNGTGVNTLQLPSIL